MASRRNPLINDEATSRDFTSNNWQQTLQISSEIRIWNNSGITKMAIERKTMV